MTETMTMTVRSIWMADDWRGPPPCPGDIWPWEDRAAEVVVAVRRTGRSFVNDRGYEHSDGLEIDLREATQEDWVRYCLASAGGHRPLAEAIAYRRQRRLPLYGHRGESDAIGVIPWGTWLPALEGWQANPALCRWVTGQDGDPHPVSD